MHFSALMYVAQHRPKMVHAVYDVGSLDINGTVRVLFPDAPSYCGIDLVAGAGVDVVGDAGAYVPSVSPDCIVCCEVLEHHRTPKALLAHLHAIARPGASLIVTCAGPGRLPHSAIDGGVIRPGEHYANVEPADLSRWLTAGGWTDVSVEVAEGEPAALQPGAFHGDVYAEARA